LKSMIATIPYYVYEMRLIVPKTSDIKSWDDLKKPRPGGGRRKVGILGGSADDKYIRENFGEALEIASFTGTTDALAKVQDGTLDASVEDGPAWAFYGQRYDQLHVVGEPRRGGYYVMYLRPEESRLRDQLNAALLLLIHNGKLRRLYKEYGLWNDAQKQLGDPALEKPFYDEKAETDEGEGGDSSSGERQRGWEAIERNALVLLEAAGMTVLLSVVSMPLAILGGVLVAMGRVYGPRPLAWLLAGYVELLRGTPVMLQLFALFYVLPSFGLKLPAFVAAVVGLALNY